MKITYKKAGVDVGRAEKFVKGLKGFISSSSISNILAFGSLFDLKSIIKKYKKPLLVSSSDGVGTKLIIAKQLNIHNTVGIDLVAMNTNDIVCLGAKPLFFLDYIACGKLKPNVLGEVVRSIKKGLEQSDCFLLGGETAEMPGMYKEDEYDLAGFCVGIVDADKIIDGRNIKPGDTIVGLASAGLHSNGFSLVRKVFSKNEIRIYGKEILKPTRIYVKPILSSLTANPAWPAGRRSPQTAIKGIAHNTGGAFYTKITKILPQGLGFRIYKNSWGVSNIFKMIQKKASLSDKDMYSTFNMGIGMVVVVNKKYAKYVVSYFNKMNFKSYIIGEVIKSKREKTILV